MIKPLSQSILIPSGLTAEASSVDAGIHKKILGSVNMTTLIISNDEIEGIIKIVKSLEYSGLLLKGVNETVQNEVKEQDSCKINRAGEGIVRASYGNKMDFQYRLIL